MFNTVKVQFIGRYKSNDKEYSYLTDLSLKEGDEVVVDTINGIKTATVTGLFGGENTHKWVVCKIDTKAFQAKLVELKRKQFLLKQMKHRINEVDVMSQYERLAETDETMKTLLKAFNSDIAAIEDKEGDLL